MFCSTVIPTIGRPTLDRTVNSVLDQAFADDDFEIIVVNDSGRSLPKASWQQSERVQVMSTCQRERSVARNTGAAIAKGRYLHFLDDDDWLLPGAIDEFWKLVQQQPSADMFYGGTYLVDPEGICLGELNLGRSGNCFVQMIAGAWVPIQASIIRREAFFAVGGFHPLLVATQDLDLCRRIALHGDLACTAAKTTAILRGTDWGSSTNFNLSPEFNRWGRNRVLQEPGTFGRLRASADSSYWHGRIFHAYASLVLFNLRHKRFMTALSRTIYGVLGFALSGRHVFTSIFWKAVQTEHVTNTFLRLDNGR